MNNHYITPKMARDYLDARIKKDLNQLIEAHHNIVCYTGTESEHTYFEYLYAFLIQFQRFEHMHGVFEQAAFDALFMPKNIFTHSSVHSNVYVEEIRDALSDLEFMADIKKRKSVWNYAADIATVDADGNITYK